MKGPNPIIFIGLTALTLVVGGGAIFMQYSALSDTQNRVAQLKKDEKDEVQLQNQLQQSVAHVQEASARLNHLEQGIPEIAYVPTMLKELEAVGTENGIEVLGVRPVPKQVSAPSPKDEKGTKSTPKAYDELDIEVTGRGSYKAIKNFVRALQGFPKIVAARTVSLSPKQETGVIGGAPKLEATISLRSYLFRAKPKTVASTDGAAGSEVKANAS